MLMPFQKAFKEIDLLLDHGIKMPNGVLDYDYICFGELKKVDVEKVKKVKQSLSSKQLKICGENIAQVNKYKAASRGKMKKLFDAMFKEL